MMRAKTQVQQLLCRFVPRSARSPHQGYHFAGQELYRGLSELIKEIEEEQMEQMLLPLLPDAWRQEIRYFTDDEFSNKLSSAKPQK